MGSNMGKHGVLSTACKNGISITQMRVQKSTTTSSENTFGQMYLLLLLLILAAGISSRGLAHLSLCS